MEVKVFKLKEGAHMAQELRYAVEQAVTDVDGAVHVQQKQPLIPQLSHGIVSFAQKYSIRIPQSCRAFKHGGASQGKLFGKRDEKRKKRPPQRAAALSLSKKAMLFGTTGSRETAFHSNYFFRRLSHFTARRVPTVEEISEAIAAARVGKLNKPCVFFNLNGYYDAMKAMLDTIGCS